MAKKPTTNDLSFTEGNDIDRNYSIDPLLYHAAKIQDSANKKKDSTSTGGGTEVSHPSLGYEVWAAWWTLPSSVPTSTLYQYAGLVEMFRPQDSLANTFRQPGDINGLPQNIFASYVDFCTRVPTGRRIFYNHWWQEPFNLATYETYYRSTSDGTTYTGGVSGFGDSVPVRFNSIWNETSAEETKISLKDFLSRCKQNRNLFDYFLDDTEGWYTFRLGGFYNTYSGTFDANGIPNQYPSYESVPDPRRTVAIVNDSRFTANLNINGKTFSQEFLEKFKLITNNPSESRTTQQLLTYFTTVVNRQDFNSPFSSSDTDVKNAYIAFDSTLYTYNFGTNKKSSIVDAFSDLQLTKSIKIIGSQISPLSSTEAKYATDLNNYYLVKDNIPNYEYSEHFYGEISESLYQNYGYTKNPSTDSQKYELLQGGTQFESKAHLAFISDIRRVRGMLRTSSSSYQKFHPLVNTPQQQTVSSRYGEDERYWYEMMYHLCLHGANNFIVFERSGNSQQMSKVQSVLDEWKTQSSNQKAIPASNENGSISSLVERINLQDAAELFVISGGYLEQTGEWLWRITTPPSIDSLELQDETQTDLPRTIGIPSNERGVWIKRSVPGAPKYGIPSASAFEMETQYNKLFMSYISVPEIGAANGDWNNLTNIASFQGQPLSFPDINVPIERAYPWECNPSDPETSSPWHNWIYENVISSYEWGARGFVFWSVYGDFTYKKDTEDGWKYETFGLTQIMQKQLYDTESNVTENHECPARWKGFKQAIKALVEGNMTPVASGKTPIDEPCRVMLYLNACSTWPGYRYRTTKLWESLGSTNQQRDAALYDLLDEWIQDIVDMKGTVPGTENNLMISLDAVSGSATPSTISLFRSIPDYKSDAIELADWYVWNALREAGIEVFVEARVQKTQNQASSIAANGSDGGFTGVGGFGQVSSQSYISDFAGYPFVAGEYWTWYSNPDYSSNFSTFSTNQETEKIFRLPSESGFPLPQELDPYNTRSIVYYQGNSLQLQNGGPVNRLFSPFRRMWQLYSLSDVYRYVYNANEYTDLSGYESFDGIKLNRPCYISYDAADYMNGNLNSNYYGGVSGYDPLEYYWKLPLPEYDYRPSFNASSFNSNPGSYTGGLWTDLCKDNWDNYFRTDSFDEFVEFLHQFSSNAAPPNTTGYTESQYYPNDEYTKKALGDLYESEYTPLYPVYIDELPGYDTLLNSGLTEGISPEFNNQTQQYEFITNILSTNWSSTKYLTTNNALGVYFSLLGTGVTPSFVIIYENETDSLGRRCFQLDENNHMITNTIALRQRLADIGLSPQAKKLVVLDVETDWNGVYTFGEGDHPTSGAFAGNTAYNIVNGPNKQRVDAEIEKTINACKQNFQSSFSVWGHPRPQVYHTQFWRRADSTTYPFTNYTIWWEDVDGAVGSTEDTGTGRIGKRYLAKAQYATALNTYDFVNVSVYDYVPTQDSKDILINTDTADAFQGPGGDTTNYSSLEDDKFRLDAYTIAEEVLPDDANIIPSITVWYGTVFTDRAGNVLIPKQELLDFVTKLKNEKGTKSVTLWTAGTYFLNLALSTEQNEERIILRDSFLRTLYPELSGSLPAYAGGDWTNAVFKMETYLRWNEYIKEIMTEIGVILNSP